MRYYMVGLSIVVACLLGTAVSAQDSGLASPFSDQAEGTCPQPGTP
jgi:hypothetical protein